MKTAIIGGGNIGTLMAGEFAAAGHAVRMLTSKPERWSGAIDILEQGGGLLSRGTLELVTDDAARAVKDADIIWITYPVFLLRDIAATLLPLVQAGQVIGVVPGACAEFFFSEHQKKGCSLLGLQRVHCIARVNERGRSVYQLGNRKPELQVAALSSAKTPELTKMAQELFDIPTVALPNYLTVTLTPSNPILHTTRIKSMFADWRPGVTYERNILFYEEWDTASASLLLACDDELQKLCRMLEQISGIKLEGVKSLRVHYESADAESLARKISGLPAFKGLTSPMREERPGQWTPDFDSRYFQADFGFGLKAICDIAALAGVDAPQMNGTYNWYLRVTGAKERFTLPQKSLDELLHLYE